MCQIQGVKEPLKTFSQLAPGQCGGPCWLNGNSPGDFYPSRIIPKSKAVDDPHSDSVHISFQAVTLENIFVSVHIWSIGRTSAELIESRLLLSKP